eukprot:12453729-Alexandrium_andersonii.AAC.1
MRWSHQLLGQTPSRRITRSSFASGSADQAATATRLRLGVPWLGAFEHAALAHGATVRLTRC